MSALNDALELLAVKKRAQKALKETLEELDNEVEDVQGLVVSLMDAEGVTSIKLHGRQYVRRHTIYGRVVDLPKFSAWVSEADEEEAESFLQTKEAKGRVNEITRERLADGDDLPPGVDAYTKHYVSITGNQTAPQEDK